MRRTELPISQGMGYVLLEQQHQSLSGVFLRTESVKILSKVEIKLIKLTDDVSHVTCVAYAEVSTNNLQLDMILFSPSQSFLFKLELHFIVFAFI